MTKIWFIKPKSPSKQLFIASSPTWLSSVEKKTWKDPQCSVPTLFHPPPPICTWKSILQPRSSSPSGQIAVRCKVVDHLRMVDMCMGWCPFDSPWEIVRVGILQVGERILDGDGYCKLACRFACLWWFLSLG